MEGLLRQPCETIRLTCSAAVGGRRSDALAGQDTGWRVRISHEARTGRRRQLGGRFVWNRRPMFVHFPFPDCFLYRNP